MRAGTLFIVSTPIGNPEDLTLRALRVLRDVSLIACETPQATQSLLTSHGIGTPLTSYHRDNKEEKTAILLSRLREGQSLALVCDAGTPVIQDPGCYLIARCREAGVAAVPVPGPSALLAALVASGWSGDRFTFAGAWPSRQDAQRKLTKAWEAGDSLVVLFLESSRLRVTLEELARSLGNRAALLGVDLTMPTERFHRGTLRALLARHRNAPFRGEMTLVLKGRRARGKERSTSARAPRRSPKRRS
jgi:16S rRNA (cytidine1402-2'-O)-methyltransferase